MLILVNGVCQTITSGGLRNIESDSEITVVVYSCGSSKLNRRRVFDAGGASLEGSALHGVVFDRSARPQKRAGEARLPGSGRESPSDPDSEGVRFGAGNC